MKSQLAQASTSLRPPELRRLLASGEPLRLIDVRTRPEFDAAHIAEAELIPLGDLDPSSIRSDGFDDDPVLYLVCQSGARATKAAALLRASGCDAVIVEGGMDAWIEAGLPVQRGQSRVLPLMRQVQLVVGTVAALGAVLALLVDKWFAILPLVMGLGLLFAGCTGTCGLALVLARMPWNRGCGCGASCAVEGGQP